MKKKTRVLALLLALVLCLSSFPISALAYSGGTVVNDDTGEIVAVLDRQQPSEWAPGSFAHGQVVDDDTGDTVVPPSSVEPTQDSTASEKDTAQEPELEQENTVYEYSPLTTNSSMKKAAARAASISGKLYTKFYVYGYVGYLPSIGATVSGNPAKQMSTDGGQTFKTAYCIAPTLSHTGSYGSSDAEVYAGLTKDQKELLGDVLACGYAPTMTYEFPDPNSSAEGKTNHMKWGVTQHLIWCVLNNSVRMNENGEIIADPTVEQDAAKLAGNCKWASYQEYMDYYYATWIKIRDLKKLPSFAKKTESLARRKDYITLADNHDGTYSLTTEDKNKVLEQFQFTFPEDSGVTVEQDGNNLTVTADHDLEKNVVVSNAAEKEIPGGTGGVLYWTNGSYQPVITPLSSTYKITAYIAAANTVTTENTLTKTSEDGEVEGISFTFEGGGKTITKTTDAFGQISLDDLPRYEGDDPAKPITYTVREITPEGYLELPPQTYTPADGGSLTFENRLMKWRVTFTKQDSETGSAQGDANLAGATYGLYKDGNLLATYNTNMSGRFTTGYYPCGTGYTLREISPSTGYLVNPTSYTVGVAPGEIELTGSDTTASGTEQVIKGRVQITKHTDKGETGIETPEEGAKFQVFLSSAGTYEDAKETERDEITIDSTGTVQTKLLPYGTYTVHQTEGWEGKEKVQDFQVFLDENGKTYPFILNNRVFEAYITVVKRDQETGRAIPASGISFKIRNVKTGEFVVQHINYPTPTDISVFQTDVTGKLMLPEKLDYGEYELIEQATAYGYVLDPTPVPFVVDGTEKQITVEKANVPQKGIIQIKKTGKVLTEDGDVVKGLAGAEFTVTAAQDITTPEGTLRYSFGELIETIRTDEDGLAQTKPLYLGQYLIEEKTSPEGYAIDRTQHFVLLKYTNQGESIQYQTLELENKRRELRVEKIDAEFSGRKLSGAAFDLYYDTNDNKELDEADGKFGTLSETEKGVYTFSALNKGGYFLVETAAPEGYVLDAKPRYFVVYGTDSLVKITAKNQPKTGDLLIKKTAEDGLVEGIKFTVSGTPATGGSYRQEFETDENGEIHVTGLREGAYTVSEGLDESTVRYIVEADKPVTVSYSQTAEVGFFNKLRRGEVYVIKTDPDYPDSKLSGAKFRVWKDVDGNKTFDSRTDKICGTLQEKDGVYWLDGLAAAGYFLQEEIAPEGYVRDTGFHYFEIEEDTVQVEITNTPDPEAGFINRKMRGSLVIYKKSGTDESLAGANFCVKNQDGEVVAEGTTGRDGTLTFEELPCGEYVYQEISAPAGYERDGTEHKFSITSQRLKVEVTAVNHQAPFYVPKTGDGRLNPTFWALILILSIAGAVITAGILIRKKGKK